jgi:hypothetical protein
VRSQSRIAAARSAQCVRRWQESAPRITNGADAMDALEAFRAELPGVSINDADDELAAAVQALEPYPIDLPPAEPIAPLPIFRSGAVDGLEVRRERLFRELMFAAKNLADFALRQEVVDKAADRRALICTECKVEQQPIASSSILALEHGRYCRAGRVHTILAQLTLGGAL